VAANGTNRTQNVGSAASRLCLNSVRLRDTVAPGDINFKLGQWVSVQRYRKHLVPVERKRRLNRIGFVWDWRDDLWEQNFAALLKFERRMGHCCVPTFHRVGDLKLGCWVATQRRNKNEMSAERRARLWNVFMGPIAYRPTPLKGRARLGKSKEARL